MGWIASRLLMLGVLLAGIGFAGQDSQRSAGPDPGPVLVGQHSVDPRLANLYPGLPTLEAVRPVRDGHDKAAVIAREIAVPRPIWRAIALVHDYAALPSEQRTVHPLPGGPPVA